MEFLSGYPDEVRMFLLLLAGIGFVLQWDDLMSLLRDARKGGDDPSEEEASPPEG